MARLKPGNYPATNRWSRNNQRGRMNNMKNGPYGSLIEKQLPTQSQIPNSAGINPRRDVGRPGNGDTFHPGPGDPRRYGQFKNYVNPFGDNRVMGGGGGDVNPGMEQGLGDPLYGQSGGATPIPGVSPQGPLPKPGTGVQAQCPEGTFHGPGGQCVKPSIPHTAPRSKYGQVGHRTKPAPSLGAFKKP